MQGNHINRASFLRTTMQNQEEGTGRTVMLCDSLTTHISGWSCARDADNTQTHSPHVHTFKA